MGHTSQASSTDYLLENNSPSISLPSTADSTNNHHLKRKPNSRANNKYNYPDPSMDILITTLSLPLLTTLIYLLLSTMHIYDDSTSSPSLGGPPTHEFNPPPPNTSSEEFLFRIGTLHIYGIRALFISVVVGGSILCAGAALYVVFAHRRRVKGDRSAQWREGGELGSSWEDEEEETGIQMQREMWSGRQYKHTQNGTPGQTRILPGGRLGAGNSIGYATAKRGALPQTPARDSASASSSSVTRHNSCLSWPKNSARVTKPQGRVRQRQRQGQAQRAVSFLRGRTRERNMRILEVLAAADHDENSDQIPPSRASVVSSYSTQSGYEIPSYYFGEHAAQSAAQFEPVGTVDLRNSSGSWSSWIPSYYFKQHDAEGRSILESEKRPSIEMAELNPSVSEGWPDVITSNTKTVITGKDIDAEVLSLEAIVSRTLTSSTVVDEDIARRETTVGLDPALDGTAGRAGQLGRDADNGWETVYCSGWRSTGDREREREEL